MVSLWSGTGSQHKAWEDDGWQIVSCDISPSFDPTFLMDILELTPDLIRQRIGDESPSWIWASVDCSTFSHCSSVQHYDRYLEPITDKARYMMSRLEHTLNIIQDLDPLFWIIENPVGKMRELPVMRQFPRHTVTYCQYEEYHPQKPTDLFGQVPAGWYPKSCESARWAKERKCHPRSPRDSRTGTQAKNSVEAGMIPYGLGRSLVDATHSSNWCRPRTIVDYCSNSS